MPSAKDELIKLIERLPGDSSLEEIIRELVFYRMAQRGLADADAGRVILDTEMGRRIRAWANKSERNN